MIVKNIDEKVIEINLICQLKKYLKIENVKQLVLWRKDLDKDFDIKNLVVKKIFKRMIVIV